MINQLLTKHLSAAFSGVLSDTVSSFTASRKGTGGYYDPEIGDYVDGTDTTYAGRGVFGSYNDFEIQASQVDINDIKLTCLQAEVTLKPKVDDIIVQDGKERNVLSVKEDPANSIWTLQLRGLNVD